MILIIESDNHIREKLKSEVEYDYLSGEKLVLSEILEKKYALILISLQVEGINSIQIARVLSDSNVVVVCHRSDVFKNFLCESSSVTNLSLDSLNMDFIKESIKNSTTKEVGFDESINRQIRSFSFKETFMDNFFMDSTLNMESLEECVKSIFSSLCLISKNDIIVLIVNVGRETRRYSHVSHNVKRNNYDNFMKFCYHQHYDSLPGDDPVNAKQIFLDIDDNSDFEDIEFNNKEISSYFSSPINNDEGVVMGSVHLGNFTNNFFNNDLLRGQLLESFYLAGSIIGNNIKYNIAIKDKKEIRNIFSKFVPDKIIDKHLDKGQIEKTGELKRVAILFTDIRSFTSISEDNSADSVVSFLNNYFNIMVKCIRDQGGVIDKFIGDAVVAIFGAPEELENPAQKALDAAMNMVASLPMVNTDNIKLPEGGFAMGIGLHVGESIVGNIGSNDKVSYTSIGDVVTIAEELEGLTKHYKKEILFSEAIANDISNDFSKVDTIKLEGEDLNICAL